MTAFTYFKRHFIHGVLKHLSQCAQKRNTDIKYKTKLQMDVAWGTLSVMVREPLWK